MYKTALELKKWKKLVKNSFWRKSIFFNQAVYVNNQKHLCKVVRIKKNADFFQLNNWSKISDNAIIFVFKEVETSIFFNFHFNIIETDYENNAITKIYYQRNEINPKIIKPNHYYWIVNYNLARYWQLQVNDKFFTKEIVL